MNKRYIKVLILLLASIFSAQHSFAQSWVTVGNSGFTQGEADHQSIAIGLNDTPFVAFEDHANGSKATVMKYNGTTWAPVGSPGFSADMVNYTSLAIDNSGTLYVAYEDYGASNKATVMKYDGNGWATIGGQGVSIGNALYTNMAIGSDGALYMSFVDIGDSCIPRISVMMYSGSSWAYIGGPRFSPVISNPVSLAVSGTTPYIAYPDSTTSRATVLKYDGSNWVPVGQPGFSEGVVASVDLKFSNGTPYVAYSDAAHGFKATVMRYNGTAWVPLGSAGFTLAEADNTALAIGASGTPYVTFSDAATANHYATVMKYDGTGWDIAGNAGLSATLANFNSIAINSAGTPYVFYQGFTGGQKGTVQKLEDNTGVKSIPRIADHIIYPSPAITAITITGGSLINTIDITDVMGRTVYHQSCSAMRVRVDVSGLTAGEYLVNINGGEMRKFVKE